MAESPDPSRRARRKLEVRGRILAAAAELFDERGFAATKVADLCERADVAHKTFFNHFGSKQDLLRELAGESLGQLLADVEAARKQGRSTRERLERFFAVVAERVCQSGPMRRELVTAHSAFGYLARRYGLRQVSVEGLNPESEPAPKALTRVIARVRDSGATTVFAEPLASPRVARTVSRESDATVAVLDPLEGLTPRALSRGADYFTVMRANLAALRRGLGCR